MDANELFIKHAITPKKLSGELNGQDGPDFKLKYRDFFSQQDARVAKGVVYVWSAEKPITRLRGSSTILYIGKTVQTLHMRNIIYAKWESREESWKRYGHIFKTYGPIKVFYAERDDPKKTESEFLKSYYESHLELPPMNRMSS